MITAEIPRACNAADAFNMLASSVIAIPVKVCFVSFGTIMSVTAKSSAGIFYGWSGIQDCSYASVPAILKASTVLSTALSNCATTKSLVSRYHGGFNVCWRKGHVGTTMNHNLVFTGIINRDVSLTCRLISHLCDPCQVDLFLRQ